MGVKPNGVTKSGREVKSVWSGSIRTETGNFSAIGILRGTSNVSWKIRPGNS